MEVAEGHSDAGPTRSSGCDVAKESDGEDPPVVEEPAIHGLKVLEDLPVWCDECERHTSPLNNTHHANGALLLGHARPCGDREGAEDEQKAAPGCKEE